MDVPGESLTHITTYVDDPSSLFALSRVNRRLRDHLADDNTWYRVFAFHFLGIGPEFSLNEEEALTLRRTESTWKKEFIQRFKIINRWEKSRSSTLRYQPHYWGVTGMHLMENVSLMTSNLQYGIVTRSFPLTGKILKGHLDASGTTNGLGIGNPNEEFSPNVTCVGLSSCGGTGRIVWGFRNGEVAVTSAPRVMDSNRPAARFTRCRVDDGHRGDVRCVLFTGREDGLVISGCSHGQVKLWDAKRMGCLWTGFGQGEDALLPDSCVKLAYAVGAAALVASLRGGDIMVWWGFQLQDDGMGGQMLMGTVRSLRITNPVQSISKNVKPAESLFVDPDSSPAAIKILVHYADEQYFLRLAVDLSSGLVTPTRFCNGPIGPLTSVKPYFVPRHGSCLHPAPFTVVNPNAPTASINKATGQIVSRESSFVLVGDTLGRVCLWNWDAEGSVIATNESHDLSTVEGIKAQVNSSRRWEAHDDWAVCAIEVNDVVIITGSVRGNLKVWDTLTFAPLRSFASPASKPSLTGQWDPVGQIILRGDLLVASVGSRILVWQAGPLGVDKKGKGKYGGKPKQRGAGNTINKWQQQIELNRDIHESKLILDDERAHAQRVYGRTRAHLSTLDQLGLSETEALQYVMMLSREDEDRRLASMLGDSQTPTHIAMNIGNTIPDDDTDGVFALDEYLDRPRSLIPRPVSPLLHSSSNVPSPRQGGRTQLQSFSSNSEVHSAVVESSQSSRIISAAGSSSSLSPVSMVSRARSQSTATTSSSFDDPEAFPAIRSSFGTPTHSTPSRSVSSLQLNGSWSRGSSPLNLLSACRSDVPGNVGQRPSPTSSITRGSPPVQAIPPKGEARSREEDEDEELRFVLELSLVEARAAGVVPTTTE